MADPRDTPANRNLVEEVALFGEVVSVYQIDYWKRRGFLPPPRQKGLGTARGKESHYEAGTAQQAAAVVRLLRRWGRLKRIVIPLFTEGYWVREDVLRAGYKDALVYLRKELERNALQFLREDSQLPSELLKERHRGRKRRQQLDDLEIAEAFTVHFSRNPALRATTRYMVAGLKTEEREEGVEVSDRFSSVLRSLFYVFLRGRFLPYTKEYVLLDTDAALQLSTILQGLSLPVGSWTLLDSFPELCRDLSLPGLRRALHAASMSQLTAARDAAPKYNERLIRPLVVDPAEPNDSSSKPVMGITLSEELGMVISAIMPLVLLSLRRRDR